MFHERVSQCSRMQNGLLYCDRLSASKHMYHIHKVALLLLPRHSWTNWLIFSPYTSRWNNKIWSHFQSHYFLAIALLFVFSADMVGLLWRMFTLFKLFANSNGATFICILKVCGNGDRQGTVSLVSDKNSMYHSVKLMGYGNKFMITSFSIIAIS